MVETRTLLASLIILVVITSFTMIATVGIYSHYLPHLAIAFFLVQVELILITVLLVRFRSSIEEIESES